MNLLRRYSAHLERGRYEPTHRYMAPWHVAALVISLSAVLTDSAAIQAAIAITGIIVLAVGIAFFTTAQIKQMIRDEFVRAGQLEADCRDRVRLAAEPRTLLGRLESRVGRFVEVRLGKNEDAAALWLVAPLLPLAIVDLAVLDLDQPWWGMVAASLAAACSAGVLLWALRLASAFIPKQRRQRRSAPKRP